VRRLVALALLALAAGRSLAHERSVSYSFWTLTADGAAVEVRLAPGDASRLGEDLDAELPRLLSLAPCLPEPASFHAPPAAPGWIARAWRVRCPRDSGALRIHSDLLLDVVPSHLHFARVGTSGAVAERVLSDGERDWPLPASPAADGAGLGDYVRLGMAHILTGYDHLVFLFALLLVCGSLGEAARVVTGFTVGHSATLALAALGWVTPARGAVEAVIGLSIALVALENVWLAGGDHRLPVVAVAGLLAAAALAGVAGRVPPQTLVGLALFAACSFALLARSARPAGLRWPVAALFGLVHGLGFAGVLAEMTLPRARLVPALLGFNVGVELGQLAAVAAAWPVLDLLARRGEPWRAAVVGYGSAGVLAMGVLWFAGRAFG